MPRARRTTLSNTPHYIYAEASPGVDLFPTEDHRIHYLSKLDDLVRDGTLVCHAYALSRHAIHLIVEPSGVHLSRSMRGLHVSFSTFWRRSIQEVEPQTQPKLFKERYTSHLFDFAKLAEALIHFHAAWTSESDTLWESSRRIFLPRETSRSEPVRIATEDIFSRLGTTPEIGRKRFEMRLDELEEAGRGVEFFRKIGDTHLKERALATLLAQERTQSAMKLGTLIEATCLMMRISAHDLLSNSRYKELVYARRLIATVAIHILNISVQDVATQLKRDKAQISRLYTQGRRELDEDSVFQSLVDSIQAALLDPAAAYRGETEVLERVS